MSDHQTEGRFSSVLQRPAVRAASGDDPLFTGILSWVVHLEEEIGQVLDVVLDHHLYVDDVQVAANHLGFHGHRCVGHSVTAPEPKFQAAHQVGPHNVFVAERSGPPPVQPVLCHGSCLGLSEHPEHGLLTGTGRIDPSGCPDHNDQANQQGRGQSDAATAQTLGDAADTVADTAHYLFKIQLWLPRSASGLIHVSLFLLPILLGMAPGMLMGRAPHYFQSPVNSIIYG